MEPPLFLKKNKIKVSKKIESTINFLTSFFCTSKKKKKTLNFNKKQYLNKFGVKKLLIGFFDYFQFVN